MLHICPVIHSEEVGQDHVNRVRNANQDVDLCSVSPSLAEVRFENLLEN